MATDWAALWAELNDRQQKYLLALYDRDKAHEAVYLSPEMSMARDRPKASEWRWVEYHGDSGLEHEIARLGLRDSGTGSTWEALAARDLVDRKWTPVTLMNGWGQTREKDMLSLQLTRRGRKLCREHLGEVPASKERKAFWDDVRAYAADLLATPRPLAVYLSEQPADRFFEVRMGPNRVRDENSFDGFRSTALVWDARDPLLSFLRSRIHDEFEFGRDRFGGEYSVPHAVNNKFYWINENTKKPAPLPEWAMAFQVALAEDVARMIEPAFDTPHARELAANAEEERKKHCEIWETPYEPQPWRRQMKWLWDEAEAASEITGLRIRRMYGDIGVPPTVVLQSLSTFLPVGPENSFPLSSEPAD